jgi:tetratricopeptide (TPR) repeat protein
MLVNKESSAPVRHCVKIFSLPCGSTPLLYILVLFFASVPFLHVHADELPVSNDAAVKLLQQGEYEKALEQLQKVFSLFPYNEAVRKNLAAAYAAVGDRQMKQKRFDEAADNFDNALKLFPDNREYGTMKGIALYSGKHFDEAAIVLDQTRQSGGDTAAILYFLGRVYYDTGNLAGALEAWNSALNLEPENKKIRDLVEKARREYTVESSMEKGYRSMFVISYDEGTKSDLADNVLEALETAYNHVGSDFSYYPSARVPVILYTRKDYRSLTAGPEWSGGLYDGKVRLPIGGARNIAPMLRGVLFHEYTHVVVGELTRKNCPTWLNEGLAEFEGRKEYDSPLAALEAAAKTGKFLSFSDMEKSLLSLSRKDAALAYQQSYAMVRFMISSYGWHKVREILVNLGEGMNIGAAIAGTFADYGLDYQGLVREWQAAALKEYGK